MIAAVVLQHCFRHGGSGNWSSSTAANATDEKQQMVDCFAPFEKKIIKHVTTKFCVCVVITN